MTDMDLSGLEKVIVVFGVLFVGMTAAFLAGMIVADVAADERQEPYPPQQRERIWDASLLALCFGFGAGCLFHGVPFTNRCIHDKD